MVTSLSWMFFYCLLPSPCFNLLSAGDYLSWRSLSMFLGISCSFYFNPKKTFLLFSSIFWLLANLTWRLYIFCEFLPNIVEFLLTSLTSLRILSISCISCFLDLKDHIAILFSPFYYLSLFSNPLAIVLLSPNTHI